jgi:hypothetical protein
MAGLTMRLAFVHYFCITMELTSICFPVDHCPLLVLVMTFLKSGQFFNENEISWQKCKDVVTDRAKCMTGLVKGIKA